MRERLLPYLACPACGDDLALHVEARDGEHVMSGALACSGGAVDYPIARGVPRFTAGVAAVEERTVKAFGYERVRYDSWQNGITSSSSPSRPDPRAGRNP